MINNTSIIIKGISNLQRNMPMLVFLLFVFQNFAQDRPTIITKIDTTYIKIGEQVHWTVTVDIDSTATVIFPEGQTFSPLETVEAFETDTTRKKDRLTLQKIYALTQFDSGAYKLPSQRIDINGMGFMTDSMLINIATIPVDTLNQKMYDIKPIINVEKSNIELWKYVLIGKLELLKDAGELKLDDDTIKQFQQILQTADLVKFAKNKPSTLVAEQDRKLVEQIVVKTHEALPEPTEEELLEQAEYQEELERKAKKKKIMVAIISFVAIILIGTTIAGVKYGFGYLKDSVFGHPTKELLEGEWVRSSYGFPPVQLETPQVLVRQEVKLPTEAKAVIADLQAFGYTSTIGLCTVGTTSITLNQQDAEPDFEKTIEQILSNFENQGAKNIITKQEEFSTIGGVTGAKVYGSGKFLVPNSKVLIDGKYTVLLFGGKGFQQYVILTWLEDDTYAQEIVDRILASVEVKTEL